MQDRRPAGKTAEKQSFRQVGRVTVIAAAVVLIGLTWIGTQNAIRAHRAEAVARVQAESLDKAVVIEEQLRRELLIIEQTLRILEYQWQGDPAHFDFAKWVSETIVLKDVSLQVFLADEHGIVRASSRSETVGSNVSARDYFRHEAQLPTDEGRMFIGALSRGLVTRRWQLNLARRLDRPDGSFAGVIALSYDTSTFTRFLQQVDLGSGGLIGVVSAETGDVWFQTVGAPGGSVSSIAGSELFRAMSDAQKGHWSGTSTIDELDRTYAFTAVPDRGLNVLIGVDRTEALRAVGDWEDGALIFASGITLLILLMAGLLLHEDWSARRRHDALARERAVLEAALTGMSDGIMMVDADLRLVEWNDRFPEYSGVPAEILAPGVSMETILRAQAEAGEFGDVNVDIEVARRMALLHSHIVFGSSERSRPNGRKLELRRNPLPGGGFVTLYSDVTTRHEAEERLRQAQTLAAIGRLTSGVAHDFNNLLASISGNAEMLLRQLGEESNHARRIAVILRAVGRGADLVRQLLAFSRKQALAPTKVNLNEVVEGIKEFLSATLGKAIIMTTEPEPELWPALVDPAQLEYVILNLTINARDAMPDGGELIISTGNETLFAKAADLHMQPGDYVFVAVTDTGTGMSGDVQRNAFEPFFTTKGVGRGTGLGLSQVHGVASQSGGGVEIDSVIGSGTTVKVYFPRAADDATEAALPTDFEAAAHPPTPPSRNTGRVLLVDDELDCRETVGSMLSSVGFTVTAAADADEALRLIDDGLHYDVLLVDFAMPGMNGMELAQTIRMRRPSVPVVFFTGGDDDWINGERWVLAKPFLSRSLIGMLSEALATTSENHPARRSTDPVA